MWPFSRSLKLLPTLWAKGRIPKLPKNSAPIYLTNTLSGKKEIFAPLRAGIVAMYSCGPTVYSRAHIGNLRAYVFSDVLARTLTQAQYRVRRVINITDVGHLASDADEGEDKMEKSARESGSRARDVAETYTKLFLEDIAALGLDTKHILFPRATDYIAEQIAMVKILEKKGHTYRTHDGIYFDTTTFSGYGKLGGIPEHHIKEGGADSIAERITLAGKQSSMHGRIAQNLEKKHTADFALWKFSPAGSRREQEWSSPWGLGFPGWHIECSAMVKALLGDTIDIHTGGIDHIPIHHNNEIAQSECVLGHPFVRYWMHGAFLTMNEERIGKSVGNATYLSDLEEEGVSPLALRYFFLQARYDKPLSYTREGIQGAQEALTRLWKAATTIREESKMIAAPSPEREQLIAHLRDDLGTPQALALLWEAVRSEELSPRKKWGVIQAAEEIFALSLLNPPGAPHIYTLTELPEEVQALVAKREEARKARNFKEADALRIHIEERGYRVEDRATGPLFHKL